MGELEEQYNRNKKSYSDDKYSAFIQRERNDPHVLMNRNQGDIFLQYQKGELSREEATDKIIRPALKSKRQLFKKDDDDDDVQGAAGEKIYKGKNLGMKKFLISVMYDHLKIERDLIRKTYRLIKC